MAAYMIFETEEWDSSWREEYGPPTRALLEKHGGQVIAVSRDGERIEGEAKVPDVIVLIEFPDRDAATAWYNETDYQPLIKLRQTGSRAETLLFEGL